MLPKGVTLRGLEVFEALAVSGSVAQASETTGLSQPAVSQQIRNLESALGTTLVDHGKRPMQLTRAGRSFLKRARAVLSELRLAQSELTVMDLSHISSMSMGIIDDFDNDMTPRLVTALAESLTKCRFKMITAGSNDITAMMRARRLHMGITATSGEVVDYAMEYPLIRDPFILVTPTTIAPKGADVEQVMRDLPFVRYEREQLISRQIDAHLARLKLTFPERFEIGSNLALMACVSRGIGWAITTPLGYMRAVRFHDQITPHPLPFPHFARHISLLASQDFAEKVPHDLAQSFRTMLQDNIVAPCLSAQPFLEGEFKLLPE
ncbi:LysR family transcriptional regulator [Cognatishimia maritima]|uniref:Transcriptional regulator, LysR family n=1 Tax=Cognatishimia maritima TaxID=870908 RepID=A0A1M5KKJ6_9RHOB|nr:LysR family transcriptional regulator [Cognatishimia maritima]SHG53327.1 transcriptional regulator, LysR family [Cognatishimia maritima]